MNGVCVKDGWNQPDLLLSQFDFESGKVVKTIHTTTLKGRCWKNTLAEMNCKTNGKMKSDAQTVYVKDLTLSDDSNETIAAYLENYQDRETTRTLGIEIDLFLKMYIHFGERVEIHENETRWDNYDKAYELQDKFWNTLTGAEQALVRLIHYTRRMNAAELWEARTA